MAWTLGHGTSHPRSGTGEDREAVGKDKGLPASPTEARERSHKGDFLRPRHHNRNAL